MLHRTAVSVKAQQGPGHPSDSAWTQTGARWRAGKPAAGYSLTRAIADIDRVRATAARSGPPQPVTATLRELCAAARLNLEGSDELSALARWMERVGRTKPD